MVCGRCIKHPSADSGGAVRPSNWWKKFSSLRTSMMDFSNHCALLHVQRRIYCLSIETNRNLNGYAEVMKFDDFWTQMKRACVVYCMRDEGCFWCALVFRTSLSSQQQHSVLESTLATHGGPFGPQNATWNRQLPGIREKLFLHHKLSTDESDTYLEGRACREYYGFATRCFRTLPAEWPPLSPQTIN